MSDREFLFVLGCPRSGTTNLTRALHAHEQIVMGMERFKTLGARRFRGLSPALFEPARFLDFREGDTNITPQYQDFGRYYEEAAVKLQSGQVRYIGDKLFPSDRAVSTVMKRFDAPRFVFIYRGLLPVANSHQVLACRGDSSVWTLENLESRVLARWNRSFALADRLTDHLGAENVFVVRFERFFDQTLDTWEALFAFLGLGVTNTVRERYELSVQRSQKQSPKPLGLSDEQQRFLLDRLDSTTADRFDARFERQLT